MAELEGAVASDDIPPCDHGRELDALRADLGRFSVRLARRLTIVEGGLSELGSHRDLHDGRLTTLEERVERLARLHDEVAADVAWMDRGES